MTTKLVSLVVFWPLWLLLLIHVRNAGFANSSRSMIDQCSVSSRFQKPAPCPCQFTYISEPIPLCYILTDPVTFPPKCPYADVAPFDEYERILEKIGFPVWLPVQRQEDGKGYFQWIEASKRYKTDFEVEYVLPLGQYTHGKDCLLYQNTSQVDIVACDEYHRALCVYRRLDALQSRLCDSHSTKHPCYPKDYPPETGCLCVGSNFNGFTTSRAEFPLFHQLNAYEALTNEECTIGLINVHGQLIWSNSNTQVTYEYWSPSADVRSNAKYGVITPNGWKFSEDPNTYPCNLFETKPILQEPRLVLSYNVTNGYLLIDITNPENLKYIDKDSPLLFCFTDANIFKTVYRYPQFGEVNLVNSTSTLLSYSFRPFRRAPGNYWCEAMTYPNLEVAKSNVVFLRNSEHVPFEHVALLSLNPHGNVYWMMEFSVELLVRFYAVYCDVTGYDLRVMKVEYLNEKTNTMNLRVHLTHYSETVKQHDSEDVRREYCKLKSKITDVFKKFPLLNIRVFQFLNADYCFHECDNNTRLTWPTATIGELVFPEEYCFRPDNTRIDRYCKGNFIKGANWDQLDPGYDCLIESEVTKELKNISATMDLKELANICMNYNKFYPIDIYLFGQIVQNISSQDVHGYLNRLSEIIDNLLTVDKRIMDEAQIKANATDTILHGLYKIFMRSTEYFEFTNFRYLRILKPKASDLKEKVVLFENGTVISTNDKLYNDSDVDSILQFSEGLLNALKSNNTNITIMIFFNNVLFNEKCQESPVSSKIFGIAGIVSDIYNYFSILQRNRNDSAATKYCSDWKYGYLNTLQRMNGYWRKTVPTENVTSYFQCKFNYGSFFSLLSLEPANITDKLQDLLQTNKSTPEIIKTLLSISKRQEEITADDVYLISKVLHKINHDSNVNLNDFTEIINNLMEVDRAVLAKSQNLNRSTDEILHSTDKIILNHNSSVDDATHRNFSVFLWTPRKHNITGVIILENEGKLVRKQLHGNVNVDEILQIENLTSAVILTPKLMAQMLPHSKVIVIVYEKDVLFNAKSKNEQNISRIFGVTVTDVDDYYQSPILIYHKVSNFEAQMSCSYWNYDSRGSFWRVDDGGTVKKWMVECEFWHTTHFALLLTRKNYEGLDSLNWITAINCILSGFGLSCIVLTAILFKNWRRNIGNQILLHFVVAIAMQIVTFYVSSVVNDKTDNYEVCVMVGVALHYSLISQFCWMFVIAVLQFKRFVEVLGGPPKYIMIKACVCGWLLPLLPVLCVLILDDTNYVGSESGLCYPSGLSLYLGVWLPIAIIVTTNLVIFLYIMFNVMHKKSECADCSSNDDTFFQWRLAVLLFFMLGLTWTFGFLSELEYGAIFVFLFCITATLQGFVMFLFFIVFHTTTRRLYIQGIKKFINKTYY